MGKGWLLDRDMSQGRSWLHMRVTSVVEDVVASCRY